MELRADGKVEFRGSLIDFDEFVRRIRDFDNVEIRYYRYLKELVISFGHYYDTLSYEKLEEGSENYRYFQELIKIYEEYEEFKEQQLLYGDLLNKGKMPKNDREKRLLINYLNNRIARIEPKIKRSKSSRIKHITCAIAAGTLTGGAIIALTGADVASFAMGSLFPAAGIGLSLHINEDEKYDIRKLEDELATYYKLLSIVKGKSNNPAEDKKFEHEQTDLLKIKKYSDGFTNKVTGIIDLIKQLPSSERFKYRTIVDEILNQFQGRVDEILENDNDTAFVLGKARDVYALYMELLPRLNKIEISLIFKVNERQSLLEFSEQIEDARDYLHEEEPLRKVA